MCCGIGPFSLPVLSRGAVFANGPIRSIAAFPFCERPPEAVYATACGRSILSFKLRLRPRRSIFQKKEIETYVDRKPIEFEAIQDKIEDLVNRGIDDGRFRGRFEDLRNFAVLQRLFRAALKGNLGSRFPALKLSILTKDTAGAAPYFHTKRWNSSVVNRMLFTAEKTSLPGNTPEPWMKKAAQKLPACITSLNAAIQSNGERGNPEACRFDELESAAESACAKGASGGSPGCLWASLVSTGKVLVQIEREEVAFGVLNDERLNSSTDTPASNPSPASNPDAASRVTKR